MSGLIINRINTETLGIPIIGTAPLVVHRWDEKAKRQMLDAQQGRRKVKEVRDPQSEYEASLYRTVDGYGVPAIGFKKAIVSACRFFGKSIPQTHAKQFIFITGVMSPDGRDVLTPIHGQPKMREDMVRVGMGTDLRFRGEFTEWTATLEVTYVTTSLARESVVSLIDAAGLGVGICEHRPEKGGMFGTFAIDESRDIEELDR